MSSKAYKTWNLSFGWGVFIIALFTFISTVEPTASFWDAGEYIATSAKLQIGHPPGAPLFQMMGAFFAMFASGPEKVALMVNMMSVFSSAFTILFLFWTLTLLLKKLPSFSSLESTSERLTFFGSATVGALTFCFSDSFWFNAVEAEVYAMATCILSLLFWMGLRWEAEMHTPRGDRWLLLIAFVIGLSFGVHFMGLLTIPALGMIYYFKNTQTVTAKGFLIANAVAIAILLFIFKLLLPLTLAFFGKSEVFFVNNFGLPFNSGTLIAALVFIAFFYFGLRYTRKQNWRLLNTGMLCILFILLGFSSWLMIPIRSNANTVINENAPSDARSLLAYYNLEQYPDTYLFYGPMFSDMYAGRDEQEPYVDDKPKYERDTKTGKYVIVNHWKKARINSHSDHEGLLPRLWSPEHAGNYMNFTQPLEFSIAAPYRSSKQLQRRVNQFKQDMNEGLVTGKDYHNFFKTFSEYIEVEKPSFWSNLQFMLQYQMGYMYWRYFMWNFTGRQNDLQGNYDLLKGNWISGIPFIDSIRLGNQKQLDEDALQNKARNTYFFLPFLVGLLGIFFLYRQDPKRFWVLLLFFLFTGLALKVYLNERPFEPRERDYALVGSFYVFAIWIGMGTMALAQYLRKVKMPWARPAVVGLCLLTVPVLMASENWDDHDRSNRYTAQSIAKAYLQSIQEDTGAIIFTIGDNDTFALWYAQDIEGFRTDVRSINTSLLQTDWYIDQMKRKTYESEPVPSQLTHNLYAYGIRDVMRYEPLADSLRWDIKDFVNWIASDHPQTKYRNLVLQSGSDPAGIPENTLEMVFYPTNKIRIPVNKENVLKSGIVKPEDAHLIVPYIDVDLPESALLKNQLMMLDIIANNDWKRPIYFTGGSYDESEYIWMKEYLQLDGLVYKLVPIRTELSKQNPYLMGRIDPDTMYDIVMKWEWGNSESPDIYHDPETRKNAISFRSNLARLAEAFMEAGDMEKAEAVMDLCMEKMPLEYYGYYSLLTPFVDGYYRVGATEKAQQLTRSLTRKYTRKLRYFESLNPDSQYALGEEVISQIERYRTLLEAVIQNKDKKILTQAIDTFLQASLPFKYLYGDYEFYTIMSDFVEGYYTAGQTEKAQQLASQIALLFQKQITPFTQLPEETQLAYLKTIKNEVVSYRYLVKVVEDNDSTDFKDRMLSDYEMLAASFVGEENEALKEQN